MKEIFHVQILKAQMYLVLLIINCRTIDMNIIRDLSVCEYAEMGIKPNTAHTGVQVPELHVSGVVFGSDNHKKKKIKKNLLSLGTDCLSWFRLWHCKFYPGVRVATQHNFSSFIQS